jgi:hypothetical protein
MPARGGRSTLRFMRRNHTRTPGAATKVMRVGKTKRDHTSGAWQNHRRNKEWRRLEGNPDLTAR